MVTKSKLTEYRAVLDEYERTCPSMTEGQKAEAMFEDVFQTVTIGELLDEVERLRKVAEAWKMASRLPCTCDGVDPPECAGCEAARDADILENS